MVVKYPIFTKIKDFSDVHVLYSVCSYAFPLRVVFYFKALLEPPPSLSAACQRGEGQRAGDSGTAATVQVQPPQGQD